MRDDLIKKMDTFDVQLKEFEKMLDIGSKTARVNQLQLAMSAPSFWDNQKEANRTVEELKILKDDVDAWSALAARLSDVRELLEVSDSSLDEELHKEAVSLQAEFERFRLRMLFKGKFDAANAIIEINSGAGGTEACDWAQMLLRMYLRWAEARRFPARIIEARRPEKKTSGLP